MGLGLIDLCAARGARTNESTMWLVAGELAAADPELRVSGSSSSGCLESGNVLRERDLIQPQAAKGDQSRDVHNGQKEKGEPEQPTGWHSDARLSHE